MPALETRTIVDTLFAVSKLPIGPSGKYFEFVLGDSLKQLSKPERVAELNHLEIAYLFKALINLREKLDGALEPISNALDLAIFERLNTDHLLMASFEPYSISKVLRYILYSGQKLVPQTVDIIKSLSLNLAQTLASRKIQLQNSDVSDLLIDVEMNDVVDILRVYSVLG